MDFQGRQKADPGSDYRDYAGKLHPEYPISSDRSERIARLILTGSVLDRSVFQFDQNLGIMSLQSFGSPLR